MFFRLQQGMELKFEYTNFRGERATRQVVVYTLEYDDRNEYHPSERWFLRCFDKEKQADRTFALSGIHVETIIWERVSV